MEKQRELIQQLEQQQHETEQRLEACPKDDEEDMLEQHQQQMDSIEHQHKIFDDMEFKQLEVVLLVNYLFKCSLRACVDKKNCNRILWRPSFLLFRESKAPEILQM